MFTNLWKELHRRSSTGFKLKLQVTMFMLLKVCSKRHTIIIGFFEKYTFCACLLEVWMKLDFLLKSAVTYNLHIIVQFAVMCIYQAHAKKEMKKNKKIFTIECDIEC